MGARRVVKRVEPVVLYLADEVERLLEVLVALARESNDDVARDRVVAPRAADRRHQVQVALPGVAAVHALERPVRAGLDRKVDPVAELLVVVHHADDIRREIAGMGRRVLDPLDTRFRRDALEKARKRVLLEGAPRLAYYPVGIGIHVLPEEVDLPVPRETEPAHFVDD